MCVIVYVLNIESFFIFLVPKPEIVLSPENVTVLPSHGFTMKCLALSFGPIKYDWNKHDGILLQKALKSYAQNVLFSLPDEGTTDFYSLTMNNVQPSDEGWYCCVATNEGGSTMQCAWLKVNSKLY